MRRLLLAALLCLCFGAHAQIALITHTTVTNNGGGTTPNFDDTGASLIVVGLSGYQNTTCAAALSDSAGNTFLTASGPFHNSGVSGTNGSYALICYAAAPITSTSENVSVGGGGATSLIDVTVWSGTATSSPKDQSTGNGPSGITLTTIQPGSVTPTQNNELVITQATYNNSGLTGFSIDSGFTISDQTSHVVGTNVGGAMAYLVQTTAGAVNPTWTVPLSAPSAAIVTFKAAPVAGSTNGRVMVAE